MISIDKSAFRRGHRAFLNHMKVKGDGVPFMNFGHRFMVSDELAYKHEALRQGRKVLCLNKWPQWRSKQGKILAAMQDACQQSVSNNLLEHKYGNENGSYSALYRVESKEDIGQLETLVADLHSQINEPDEVMGQTFDVFATFLKEKSLGCKWEFVVYFLFLMRPERFFPIRSTYFERVLQFYGVDCQIAGRVEWERYKLILDVAELVKEELRQYGSPSALEVQSYMWVVSYLVDGMGDENDDTSLDFDDELERRQRKVQEQQRIGFLGEMHVFESERECLITSGREDLAARVRLISSETDDAGYDILSYTAGGAERHIEVKSTSQSEHDEECFWISDNEVQTASSDSCWTLLRVWRADSEPHHRELGNIVTSESEGWERQPSSWIVRRTTGSSPETLGES